MKIRWRSIFEDYLAYVSDGKADRRIVTTAEAVEKTGVVHRLGRYIVREANATPAAASSSPTSSARDLVTRSRRNAHIQDFTNFVRQNATILISLTSLLISLCAVTFTAYQVFATRKHNRLQVRPHLTTFAERNPIAENNQTKITWRLVNHGLEPAVIDSYSLFVDNEVINTNVPSACLRALNKAFGTVPANSHLLYLGNDYLMGKDESLNVLIAELPTPPLDKLGSLDDINEFDAGLKRFKLSVAYRSLYGDKFLFKG